MKNIKVILSAIAVSFAAPVMIAHAEPTEMAHAEATMMTVHVKGMVCDFCARAVNKVFGKEEAVKGVHVDLDSGEIHVSMKPGMSMTDERVEELVTKSGYSLVSVERETL